MSPAFSHSFALVILLPIAALLAASLLAQSWAIAAYLGVCLVSYGLVWRLLRRLGETDGR